MKVLNLTQGSDEWNAVRSRYFTASAASAMMGASTKCTRGELIRMKATGTEKEFSEWVQKNLLDKGHEIEAKARPIAEKVIGEDLYPATAVDDTGTLLASFDGLTMLEEVCWECKSSNQAKIAAVQDGRIPDEDFWQVVHQTAIGPERCLYTVSDGTEEGSFHVWYERNEDDIKELMAGWKQFEEDLTSYQHIEEAPAPTGKTPDSLPALRIELTGMVTASNLDEFKDSAISVISAVNTDLQTDQDFADAEKATKWAKEVEARLDAAKQHALSQTADIDELFRTLDEIKEYARSKRLELEKLVKSRKQSIRAEIAQAAKDAMAAHIDKLNKRISPMRLPPCNADFVGAMKNKRTVSSLRDSVDQVLAQAKIESSQWADEIEANLRAYEEMVGDYRHLFADLQQIVMKPADDFAATVKLRIAEYQEAERKRMEAERERIRKEEEAKANQKAEQEAVEPEKPSAPTLDEVLDAAAPKEVAKAMRSRPSDQEIIEVLTLHYRVHEMKVIEWLLDMDLTAAEKEIAKAEGF